MTQVTLTNLQFESMAGTVYGPCESFVSEMQPKRRRLAHDERGWCKHDFDGSSHPCLTSDYPKCVGFVEGKSWGKCYSVCTEENPTVWGELSVWGDSIVFELAPSRYLVITLHLYLLLLTADVSLYCPLTRRGTLISTSMLAVQAPSQWPLVHTRARLRSPPAPVEGGYRWCSLQMVYPWPPHRPRLTLWMLPQRKVVFSRGPQRTTSSSRFRPTRRSAVPTESLPLPPALTLTLILTRYPYPRLP